MPWDQLADYETVEKVMATLRTRGIAPEAIYSRQDALERLKEIIPDGAQVMTGGSRTLEEIGFTDMLKSGNHPWKNLKDEILAEKDPAKQVELRRKSVLSTYFLGSVHAVTQDGEILIASASGSQLPAYAYTSSHVIWVVGTQKIVRNLEEGVKRVFEYCLPLEDKRMKSIGSWGSTVGKLLIFNREINPSRKIVLIFVKEKLGF